MELLRAAALLAATMTMGIMTGVFQLYAYAIMPGLGRTDDRTFIGAFQQIDRAIISPWLFVSFFGTLVFTGLAAALRLGGDERSALPWIVGAFALYLPVVVITLGINSTAQRRDQGSRGAGSDRRSRRSTRAVRRSEVGPLEPLPGSGLDGRVRLPRMGAGVTRTLIAARQG